MSFKGKERQAQLEALLSESALEWVSPKTHEDITLLLQAIEKISNF